MNYVVAALLLGRLPETYTNVTEIGAVVDDAAAPSEEDAESNGSGVASAEPAANIIKAAVDADVMPGTMPPNDQYIS